MSDDRIKAGMSLMPEFTTKAVVEGYAGRKELRAWVKDHPGLLDPALDQPIEDWLRSVQEAEQEPAATLLSVSVELRRACRDYGVDAVVDRELWADEEYEKARTLRGLRSDGATAEVIYSRTRSLPALQNVMLTWDRVQKAAEEADAPWLIRTEFALARTIAYLKWYRAKHDWPADSDTALATLETIATQLPRTSGLRLNCLMNAGFGWANRAVDEESQTAMDRAIKYYGQVMSDYQGTGRTDSQVIKALGILSRLLWNRYRMTGDTRDLREAGRARQAWLAFNPVIDPDDNEWEAKLAAALAKRG